MQQGNLALAKEKLDARREAGSEECSKSRRRWPVLYERLDDPEDAERILPRRCAWRRRIAEVAEQLCRVPVPHRQARPAIKLFLRRPPRTRCIARPGRPTSMPACACARQARMPSRPCSYPERARPAPGLCRGSDGAGRPANWSWATDLAGTRVPSIATWRDAATPEVLLVGVRARCAMGDRPAADNYARRLRRDFPTSVETRQLLEANGLPR